MVVDAASGALSPQGLGDCYLQLSLVDGRRLESEGPMEDALTSYELLTNKAGHPLLTHGRSGNHSDEHRVVVPMIAGQAMLPDLKVTDSSEALLAGRAPPFRLLARVVHRGGMPVAGIGPVLSEPFVVATARVKGAAKVEIPHIDDHISKLEGLGVQTQKKLEDIAAAAAAANVHNLQVPHNCVTKVGQFRDLVETAERSKSLRETLKQVLRLTKGWDVAREHVRRAVHTDTALRVFHPDWNTEAGPVFRCGAFNVIDIEHPVGLLRRRRQEGSSHEEIVDVLWLGTDPSLWPEAVRRLVPQAMAAWWKDRHPGWAFLPLNISHLPKIDARGNPTQALSTFSFAMRTLPSGPTQQDQSTTNRMIAGDAAADQTEQQSGLKLPASSSRSPLSSTGGSAFHDRTFTAGFPAASPEYLPGMVPTSEMGNGIKTEPFSAMNTVVPPTAHLSGGATGPPSSMSMTPFEDPFFQQMMQMVASNNGMKLSSGSEMGSGNSQKRQKAPVSDSEVGGMSSKGKRKADASLETFMQIHSSLDQEISLPPNLAGMDSLVANAPPGTTKAIAAAAAKAAAGALRDATTANFLSGGTSAFAIPTTMGGVGTVGGSALSGNKDGVLDLGMTGRKDSNMLGHVPLAEFVSATQRQFSHQRRPQDLVAARRGHDGRAVSPTDLPDSAPAQMPSNLTMGDLRTMFAKALRSEIAFEDLEKYLCGHGLLPGSSTDRAQKNAAAPDYESNQRAGSAVTPEASAIDAESRGRGEGPNNEEELEDANHDDTNREKRKSYTAAAVDSEMNPVEYFPKIEIEGLEENRADSTHGMHMLDNLGDIMDGGLNTMRTIERDLPTQYHGLPEANGR